MIYKKAGSRGFGLTYRVFQGYMKRLEKDGLVGRENVLNAFQYSFPEQQRAEIFSFIIAEIRKYSDCTLALGKESADVWQRSGLNPSRCACGCQFDAVEIKAGDN
jgi:hypothetical protein